MDFFNTDFGTIILWVLGTIVLVPVFIVAFVVALGAILFTIFKIVWIVAKLSAIVLVIAGMTYLVLFVTDNLSILH